MGKGQNSNGGNANQTFQSSTPSSSKSASGTGSASSTSQSNYGIVKDGWGSRSNFQASHGLKMDPSGLEQGKAILDGYQKYGK